MITFINYTIHWQSTGGFIERLTPTTAHGELLVFLHHIDVSYTITSPSGSQTPSKNALILLISPTPIKNLQLFMGSHLFQACSSLYTPLRVSFSGQRRNPEELGRGGGAGGIDAVDGVDGFERGLRHDAGASLSVLK